ncbi:uncharacterized protein RHOBADRAFT_47350 [Rhodotorula graminis WP1]|uniref:Uncharacterized protein n=1 Tax=Rhodotorula graminis (strain WP1) TaxID=578459 RepID=A0A0P9GWV7_RHOGW|nr:uncharacterized protein RHOBADRAFT_47350 [Rhodotorula graminis WP1]KPV71898.1 hypothetical protein RHOBADRAFT_47350 [Rhodotorula graminis WP1]
MSRRPSVADEAAYPPYKSRPSLTASDVETTPAGHGARAPYRAGSAVGAGGGEGRYLQAAQQIELTQEDKQEGYDATLLNLPERNTTAVPPAHEPVPGFLPSAGPPAALAANLPYASRARDDSFDDVDHKRRSNGTTGGGGGGGGTRKKGVRHDATSAAHDHHRSRTSGGGAARQSSSRRRASKKRQLKWYQKPLALGALLALLLVFGLAVGLGVGLTKGKKSDDGKASTANVGSSAPVPPGGIQPSQSSTTGNDIQVSASSSDAAVGVAGVTMQPTAAADGIAPTVAVRPAVSRVTATATLGGEAAARRAARWA